MGRRCPALRWAAGLASPQAPRLPALGVLQAELRENTRASVQPVQTKLAAPFISV